MRHGLPRKESSSTEQNILCSSHCTNRFSFQTNDWLVAGDASRHPSLRSPFFDVVRDEENNTFGRSQTRFAKLTSLQMLDEILITNERKFNTRFVRFPDCFYTRQSVVSLLVRPSSKHRVLSRRISRAFLHQQIESTVCQVYLAKVELIAWYHEYLNRA